MNIIEKFFDQAYINNFFNHQVLPLYPEFKSIERINILPAKKNVWKTTYHVVINYATTFISPDGARVELPIYLTAHSNEPRKNSFDALSFLWQTSFGHDGLMVPRPLFFSEEINGFFYRGVQGHTLYHYIKTNNFQEIEDIVAKAAAWFAKLHGLPTTGVKNFNPENSRIETVIPGEKKVLAEIEQNYPEHFSACQKIFRLIGAKEERFFKNGRRYLIHGDAHPRNIVKISQEKIAVIDFTDVCLADFARDLGAFTQQLEYMSMKKIDQPDFIEKIKKLFLDSYFHSAEIKPDDYLNERINYYYNWTAFRTATFFLLKENPEPDRSIMLLHKIIPNLKINS